MSRKTIILALLFCGITYACGIKPSRNALFGDTPAKPKTNETARLWRWMGPFCSVGPGPELCSYSAVSKDDPTVKFSCESKDSERTVIFNTPSETTSPETIPTCQHLNG